VGSSGWEADQDGVEIPEGSLPIEERTPVKLSKRPTKDGHRRWKLGLEKVDVTPGVLVAGLREQD
jgi:hypothetical protein